MYQIVNITSLQMMFTFRQLLDKLRPLMLACHDRPKRMQTTWQASRVGIFYNAELLSYRGCMK